MLELSAEVTEGVQPVIKMVRQLLDVAASAELLEPFDASILYGYCMSCMLKSKSFSGDAGSWYGNFWPGMVIAEAPF